MTTRSTEDPKFEATMELAFQCHRVWRDFEGDDPLHRTCLECGHEVHNISAMARAEAREFLRERSKDGRLCIYMVQNSSGTVFADDPRVRLARQREGIKRLVLAAAVVSPLLIAGCDDGPRPRVEEVVVSTPDKSAPGASVREDTPHTHAPGEPCSAEPPTLVKAKRTIERLFADLFGDEEDLAGREQVELAGALVTF